MIDLNKIIIIIKKHNEVFWVKYENELVIEYGETYPLPGYPHSIWIYIPTRWRQERKQVMLKVKRLLKAKEVLFLKEEDTGYPKFAIKLL